MCSLIDAHGTCSKQQRRNWSLARGHKGQCDSQGGRQPTGAYLSWACFPDPLAPCAQGVFCLVIGGWLPRASWKKAGKRALLLMNLLKTKLLVFKNHAGVWQVSRISKVAGISDRPKAFGRRQTDCAEGWVGGVKYLHWARKLPSFGYPDSTGEYRTPSNLTKPETLNPKP